VSKRIIRSFHMNTPYSPSDALRNPTCPLWRLVLPNEWLAFCGERIKWRRLCACQFPVKCVIGVDGSGQLRRSGKESISWQRCRGHVAEERGGKSAKSRKIARFLEPRDLQFKSEWKHRAFVEEKMGGWQGIKKQPRTCWDSADMTQATSSFETSFHHRSQLRHRA